MIRLRLDKGSYAVEVEGNTPTEVIEAAELFSAIPSVCPVNGCGHPLHLTVRKPQGFDYYGLACSGPVVHETTFGERKVTKALYYKGEWQEAPRRGRDECEEPAPPPPARTREPERPQPAKAAPASSGTRGGERSTAPASTREPRPRTATVPPREDPPAWQDGAPPQEPPAGHFCAEPHCGKGISAGQAGVSARAFGKPLCPACQRGAREQLEAEAQGEPAPPAEPGAAATVEQRNELLQIIGQGKRAGWLPPNQATEYLRFAQDKDLHYGAAAEAISTLKTRAAQVARTP